MALPLLGVLEEAKTRGFLGPGAVEAHVEHAAALAALAGPAPASFLDLGAGGGVPGLVLAREWPHARGILVESQRRRCEFLEWAVAELGQGDRIAVACGRAEDLARRPEWRGGAEVVAARAFAAPAVTAECAVGFLRPGGRLVVAEPPESGDSGATRWPAAGVAELGLRGPERRRGGGITVAVLTAGGPVADRWPRRAGMPAKRPVWGPR